MAKPKHDKKRQPQQVPAKPAAQVRVDPAHVIADGRVTASEMATAQLQSVGVEATSSAAHYAASEATSPFADGAMTVENESLPLDPAALVQQVRTHATQLAGHLRRQQGELDHRESQLNSRTADLESQMRSARLWLKERQEELAQQKAELDERQRLLGETFPPGAEADAETREQVQQLRAAELAAAESNWQQVCKKADSELAARSRQIDQRARDIDERQTELDLRSAALDARELELNLRQAQLEATQKSLSTQAGQLAGEQIELLRAERDQLAARCRSLEEAETLLAQEQAEVARERHELIEKREEMDELARAECRKLADLERELRADVDKKRQTLRRRTDDLDARKAALKQLRSEVGRAQREVLEMRLATEELWAKLCGTLAPAALTQSLSQIRIKLADQNRLALVELTEQKSELQALAARVQEQHEKSSRHKQELQDWMNRRQQEIESQAAHLVAREQQVDAQETEFARRELAWQDERFGYQQEIRKLLRQQRRTDAVAA